MRLRAPVGTRRPHPADQKHHHLEGHAPGERAIVNVTMKGGEAFGNKTLKVGLRKEAGAWKIDSINGRLNP